jgi:hypothetical protein
VGILKKTALFEAKIIMRSHLAGVNSKVIPVAWKSESPFHSVLKKHSPGVVLILEIILVIIN